ncbi:hypothetical protein [Haloarcula sp. JP-L23]|uniref:hypothetical protein n=1 Tax=Haloarcula sp. JP-L23 TaxID=2716717 RepID=UPI00140EC081|nr:hypothetical protein G9465_15270 [Haloarcula sp. JP-L23]
MASAASYPYDAIEGDSKRRTIRYTKNSQWHSYIEVPVSSTVYYQGSFQENTEPYRWNHKFSINTQVITVDERTGNKKPFVENHSTKITKEDSSSLTIDGEDSEYVGAWPNPNSNIDLANVATDMIDFTASLLSDAYSVASAGSKIADELDEGGNKGCNDYSCHEWNWSYGTNDDKEEAAHQAYWFGYIDPDDYGNMKVTTQGNTDTPISFMLTVGGFKDYSYIEPADPPSTTSTSDLTTTDQKAPEYLTREQAKRAVNDKENKRSGIPSAQDMTAKEKQEYGVKQLDEPKTLKINGQKKEFTHIADNLPIQIHGLEPEK